ncbi:MAG TPA: protein kinase [Candidatus Sulfotelmatobacter sp.]|nr:protein kinase [Candidatus Sulfotelmatobacter sp.]
MPIEQVPFPNRVKLGDDFELDPRAYELRRGGRSLKLERIPMELLLLLVEQRGQLVTREQIIEKIWGKDVFLDADTSINSAVRKIRQVLKDDPEQPRFIQTVTGRGYRFIASITEVISDQPRTAPKTEPLPADLVGQTISHYRILSKLGSGGMGVVYEAEDVRLGRRVALKLLPEHLVRDPKALQRFEREARAASSLNHPGICTIYEVEEQEHQPIIVMELLEGESLKDRIRKRLITVKECLDVSVQVSDALQTAHTKGIMHRDIKPGNIFVVGGGRTKILDFGLAKVIPSGLDQAELQEEPLTLDGVLPGTTAYMSPEQVRGEEIDTRSDLFSLGVVMYEMATGQRPFNGKNRVLIMNAIQNETPPCPSRLNPKLPMGLDDVIAMALQKDREKRHQHAADICSEVQQLKQRMERGEAAVPRATSIRAAAEAPAGNSQHRKKLWVGGLVVAGIVLLFALGFGMRWRHSARTTSAPIRSVAVLPLENLTGDPDQQYFSDGMTDAIITDLAEIGSLRVISRTSAMHYRDSHKTLPEIAKELGVDAVVEGSVARAGNRVRIDAQLIQASDDRHLWAKGYERDIKDVLALQGELARTIASEVRVQLSPSEEARLTKPHQVNPEAYEAYLEGRFFWNKRNKEAIGKSVEYFNQAIRIDPGYASAYAGLADAYFMSACGIPSGLSPKEAAPKAKAAALKAVELDDTSAEAHTALGMFMQCYDGTASAVEQEYRKAIGLNPNYALAHHYYALLLLGWRNQEGLEQVQEALRLDPVSPNTNGLYADFLMETRQFDKAIEQFRKTVELDPHQYNSRVRLGFAYDLVHRYREAEGEFQEAEKISPETLSSQVGLAYTYGLEGRKAEVEKMLPTLETRAVQAGHPWWVCLLNIGLDRKEEAMRWLERAHTDGDFFFNLDSPHVDPLRADPRFQDLEKQVKNDYASKTEK